MMRTGGIAGQFHRFARRIVRQAQYREFRSGERLAASFGIAATVLFEFYLSEFATVLQPLANLKTGGALGAVDEEATAHFSRLLAQSGFRGVVAGSQKAGQAFEKLLAAARAGNENITAVLIVIFAPQIAQSGQRVQGACDDRF